MGAPLAQVVDWGTLGEVAVYSLAAGVGLPIAFSTAILGATRFVDMRRDGRPLEAGFYAVLMTLGLVATLGAVIFGVIVMTSKG
jgi:hypothetical protein